MAGLPAAANYLRALLPRFAGQGVRVNRLPGIKELMKSHGAVSKANVAKGGGINVTFSDGTVHTLSHSGFVEQIGKAGGHEANVAEAMLRKLTRGGKDVSDEALGAALLGKASAGTVSQTVGGVASRGLTAGLGTILAADVFTDATEATHLEADRMEALHRLQMEARAEAVRVQRLQQAAAQNTMVLATRFPDVYNQLVAGRTLAPGTVAIGDPGANRDLVDQMAMLMASGAIDSIGTGASFARTQAQVAREQRLSNEGSF